MKHPKIHYLISGLALIYKKHLSDPANQPEATKKAIKWIKDKIMHTHFMKDIEDRLLVERLMNTCLIPFNLESLERMKKLFLLFTTIDEYATKAFIGVSKIIFVVLHVDAYILNSRGISGSCFLSFSCYQVANFLK